MRPSWFSCGCSRSNVAVPEAVAPTVSTIASLAAKSREDLVLDFKGKRIEKQFTSEESTDLGSSLPPNPTQDECSSWSTVEAAGAEGSLLQMTGDKLCIRTMHVTYIDADGRGQSSTRTGYNVTTFLPVGARDVEVSFSVLWGSKVCKVDREHPDRPWLRDQNGRILEKFSYVVPPPQVQFFICGPALHSWVYEVDVRQRTENLIELISRDFACVRTMIVSYTDTDGSHKVWSKSGYRVKFHIPALAINVEVTFSVVGGRDFYRVDRRLPGMPWVEDANGEHPRERLCYSSPPVCVQYEARGTSLHCYISRVREQQSGGELLAPSHMLCHAPSVDNIDVFHTMLDSMPAVGGLVELQLPHSEFLLPLEVVLFEPHKEIFAANGHRQIFANTPLLESENEALGQFHQHLAKAGIGDQHGSFPRFMQVHALRMLQTCKFNAAKTAKLIDVIAKERVTRLPMTEASVLDNLRKGFIYWHGRDKQCRPCMVLRLERLGGMVNDKEAVIRTVIFTLEYALRFVMVPGRVENWVVLLDLANMLSIISPWQISSLVSTAAALGKTLEQVYCGRMVWMKIVNMPGGDMLRRAINGVIPEEKKEKVSFSRDIVAEFQDRFEPNQLEKRYGGSAPDVEEGQAYPFRFFPNCRGALADQKLYHEEVGSIDSGIVSPEDFSLHEATNLAFHEGQLWDESSAAAREKWMYAAGASSLPPAAAQALTNLSGGFPMRPCCDVETWLKIVLRPGLKVARCRSGPLLVRSVTTMIQGEKDGRAPSVWSFDQKGCQDQEDDISSASSRDISSEVVREIEVDV